MTKDDKNIDRAKVAGITPNFLGASILVSSLILSGSIIYTNKSSTSNSKQTTSSEGLDLGRPVSALEGVVLPGAGVILPVTWGNLGSKLVSVGVIDGERFRALYKERGQFPEEFERLLSGENAEKLKITEDNAGYLLNLLWALGLASKNPVLDTGEMTNPSYGGASNFASTGGWTMAKGNPMDHYSRHLFFNLTPEQQALVDKVSRGVYRPCCGNSTHFPDCNHGMAMLGLLELMASQGISEQEMWRTALAVSSYWFPDNYLTIATYMKSKGVEWQDVKPQEMLGFDYSSASGYARIASQVASPASIGGGSGCSVGDAPSVPVVQFTPRQQSGCGI